MLTILIIKMVMNTHIKKPQDSKEVADIYQAWYFDILYRWIPGINVGLIENTV